MFENFRQIARNRRLFPPVTEVTAGMAAEAAMAQVLTERFADSAYSFHQNLRIPFQGGRREVDFLITAPDEIWLVELKNWSGFIGLDGRRVIQHRSGGRGIVDHKNLLKTMKLKERALGDFLRPHLTELPSMVSILVFWNPSVSLSEELLASEEVLVMEAREFFGSLPPAPPHYGPILRTLMKLFGRSRSPGLPRLSSQEAQKLADLRAHLSTLGSWDHLQLHGGQILSGDLLRFSSPELQRLLTRGEIHRIEWKVPRSYLDLFRPPLEIGARVFAPDGTLHQLRLDLEATLDFHCAGQPRPETFALRHLNALRKG